VHGNLFQIAGFLTYFLLVPGVPLAVLVARRSANWALVFALSPVFSVGGNFLALSVFNLIGIRLELEIFAIFMTLLALVALLGRVKLTVSEIRKSLISLVHAAPCTVLGVFIWTRAFNGYAFLAANQDSFNHNKWIARIIQTNSGLLRDSYVSSPLQKLGAGTGFYPMAWHSAVAIGSSLSGLFAPEASLLSIIVLWVFVLPCGLQALAKILNPDFVLVGTIAGLLVQTYALVPGVPLSWGSMTSAAGISLLPVSLAVGIYALKQMDKFWATIFIGTATTLFFVHTPEAATLLVLVLGGLVSGSFSIGKRLVFFASGAAITFGIPLLVIFRSTIFGRWSDFDGLFGAVQLNWDIAVEHFFRLDVNVAVGSTFLVVLFIYGLVQSIESRDTRWFPIGVLALLLIYLISGAPDGPLHELRFLTLPWYASYERTLWVVVPFAALASAIPIARVIDRPHSLRLWRFTLSQAFGVSILVFLMSLQITPTINQLRTGPQKSAMVGLRDIEVMRKSLSFIKKEEIALSWAGDGSTFPFSYFQVPSTAGQTLDKSGEINPDLTTIYSNIVNLCKSEIPRDIFLRNKISIVYFGTTIAWGQVIWTESEVRRLKGLKIVGVGEKLIVTVPDLSDCK
jgi:hypothetical protein